MMDVENLLATASENLSVRRAFGTAYEKDGMLIIPVALVAGGGGGGTGTARSRRDDSAASPGAPPEAGPARHGTGRPGAHGRRRGFRRSGAAVRCLRGEGRPGPLGTRGGRDDRCGGLAEPGAGARPHLDPPEQAPAMMVSPASGTAGRCCGIRAGAGGGTVRAPGWRR